MKALTLPENNNLAQIFFLRHMRTPISRNALPNQHKDMEVVTVLSGKLCFRSNTYATTLEPGDICFIYPGSLHLLEYSDDIDLMICMISCESLKDFEWDPNARYLCLKHPELLPYFRGSLEMLETDIPMNAGNSAIYESVIKSYAALFTDMLKKESQHFVSFEQSTQALDIFEYINRHFKEDLSIDFLAKKFYLSTSYLSRLMRTQCNATPIETLSLARLFDASFKLLHTNDTVNNISSSCGYTNLITFQKAFNRRYNCSPSVFRSRYKDICLQTVKINIQISYASALTPVQLVFEKGL